jgi:MFS family permease
MISARSPSNGDNQPPDDEMATQAGPQPIEVDTTTRGPSFREVLSGRDFRLLFIGQLGTEIGNGLVQLALPFLVLELTNSGFQALFAYAIQFIPVLVFGILGGVLVDRWDRRMTIVVVDTIRAVAFLAVGTVYFLDRGALSVEYIYGLIILEASLQNFFNPARLALMPNLVSKENLRAGNSLIEVTRNIGFLVAPSVGLGLAGLVGSGAIIAADGVTFLISGLTVFLIRWRPPQREQPQYKSWQEGVEGVWRQTKEGIAVMRSVRLLQVALLLGVSLNLVVAPIQGLLPLFVIDVKDVSNEQAYVGLLAGAFVTGSIVGSLSAPTTSRHLGLGRLTIAGVLLLGIIISVASWIPTLWSPIVALLIAGFAIGTLNVAQINMLQTSSSDEERGRVSAAYYTSTLGVRPLGYLAVGLLYKPIGIQGLFVILGLITLAVGTFLARLPEIREHR